jgi:hypothetical protein
MEINDEKNIPRIRSHDPDDELRDFLVHADTNAPTHSRNAKSLA